MEIVRTVAKLRQARIGRPDQHDRQHIHLIDMQIGEDGTFGLSLLPSPEPLAVLLARVARERARPGMKPA